jgi:anti-sigma factor RsiW
VAQEREVGGLRCSEVLALLSEFVDGELAPARVDAIRVHLSGCDTCERFGQEFAEVVGNFRTRLGVPRPVPSRVAEELDRVLKLDDSK